MGKANHDIHGNTAEGGTMKKPLIISLFDYTGIWSQPYRDHKYPVLQIDIQNGHDIYQEQPPQYCHGLIMQPPCTDFANSGARWFAQKDADGRTDASIQLVIEALKWLRYTKPNWWVLENPAGRIHKLIPALGQPIAKFSPHEYGESYRKTTWLWGKFTMPIRTTPHAEKIGVRYGQPDQWYSRVGGRDGINGRNYRSKTSEKFAEEFFKVNP
jgi:hypothetical protein